MSLSRSLVCVLLRVPAGFHRRVREPTETAGQPFSFTPRSAGSQGVIEIEASVGDLTPAIFTVNVGEPPTAIVRVSGNNQSGRPGTRLPNPFVVEVVDENDDPVSGVAVTFAVTAGGGSVSPTSATTNNGGRAQTTLTLGDEVGDNTVQARVTGLRAATFTASAGATVLVESDKRAPMYWVGQQKGTLHRLVDGEVEDLAPAVTGVTGIAVDSANGLLYFAVQNGNNKGAIQRSRLNGRNVQTLKALTAAPIGIAVDSAGSTVYWTNSRGRIQSIARRRQCEADESALESCQPDGDCVVQRSCILGRATRQNPSCEPHQRPDTRRKYRHRLGGTFEHCDCERLKSTGSSVTAAVGVSNAPTSTVPVSSRSRRLRRVFRPRLRLTVRTTRFTGRVRQARSSVQILAVNSPRISSLD